MSVGAVRSSTEVSASGTSGPSHCEIVGGMAQIFVPCHVIHLHACTGDQRRTFARVPNIVAMTQRDDFADDTQSVSNGAKRLTGAAPRDVEGRRTTEGAAGFGRLRCRYYCVSGRTRLVRRRSSQALSLPNLVSFAVRCLWVHAIGEPRMPTASVSLEAPAVPVLCLLDKLGKLGYGRQSAMTLHTPSCRRKLYDDRQILAKRQYLKCVTGQKELWRRGHTAFCSDQCAGHITCSS